MTNYPEITRRVALPRAERPDGWSVTTAYGALAWNAVRCAVSVPCPGRFSPIKGATQQSFSAVETVWRRMQSAANPSPAKFPANREKYREFREFSRPIPTVSSGKRLILDSFRCHESVFGPNRTGNYQGRIREFAFPVNPGLQGNLGSLHLAIKRSPDAPDLHGRHEDSQPQNLTFEKLFACQCLPG